MKPKRVKAAVNEQLKGIARCHSIMHEHNTGSPSDVMSATALALVCHAVSTAHLYGVQVQLNYDGRDVTICTAVEPL